MFRLKESIKMAKDNGVLGRKAEFAQSMWPNSSARSARMNLSNLVSGKSKKIDIENVPLVCERLGVSADYLFGLSDVPNQKESKDNIVEHARAIIEQTNNL